MKSILSMYLRSTSDDIEAAIDIYSIDSKTKSNIYYIGSINCSRIYINNSGIYEYYYGNCLHITYVKMKKVLNIYLRNCSNTIINDNYFNVSAKPSEQLFVISSYYFNGMTRNLYLGKSNIYRFNIYHWGNKCTFIYRSDLQ